MAAELVLEIPESLQSYDFAKSIIRIEHVPNPAIYYGSRVPVVTLDTEAEPLGIHLAHKPVYGNLYTFKILFEGVVCWGQEDALRHAHIPIRGVRPDKLIQCGAGRVFIAPALMHPLPVLR